MSIELLWIIPAVAFAFFILLLIILSQKTGASSTPTHRDRISDQHPLIDEQKPGTITEQGGTHNQSEQRLHEIEHKLNSLTSSLTQQEAVVARFQQENRAYDGQIKELKQKLNVLHKEYDLVVSENYSLRARVKHLKKDLQARESESGQESQQFETPPEKHHQEEADTGGEAEIVNMRMFDDTRRMKIVNLEDTAEIDLAELQ